MEKTIRVRAYLLVMAGFLIINLGYMCLLLSTDHDVTGPVTVAIIGFAVSTSGYISFCRLEKRTRFRTRNREQAEQED